MNKERIIDMHVHSDNSPDGIHSPMYICEQAYDKHLRAVAFTDHCEIDKFFTHKYNNMVLHSYFECSKARVAFEGQLLVMTGLEIAQPLHDITLTKKIVNSRPYDVILGSIHSPEGYSCDIKEIEYDKIDVYDFMRGYFRQLTEIAYCDEIDVLAHITCPMRRIQGKYNIDFDYSVISKETDELLKAIIEHKKSLEINTSGLRQLIGRTMPDENIIKRYKELGGQYITIGSDSHSANDVGGGIREGMLLAKKCGFDKLNFYVEREIMSINNNI
ncbi:MAG: histidinol-phosphatase HisJ family protein [Acutalibacteraceae bacterium]|nr:histidinol-phosphatase HisJ family protein [Acutalibacteraceae bacterium]